MLVIKSGEALCCIYTRYGLKNFAEIITCDDQELVALATIKHQTNVRKMEKLSRWVSEMAVFSNREVIAGKAEAAINILQPYSEPLSSEELNEEYSWTDAVVTALLTGWPIVSIETFSPYAKNYPEGFRTLDDLAPEDRTGLAIWKMFVDLKAVFPHIDLVSMLDDYSGVNSKEGEVFLANMIRFMHQEGALLDRDYPGEDVVLIPESRMANKSTKGWERFYTADGKVVESAGEVRFVPSAAKIKSLNLHSKNRRKELKRQGVLLFRDGQPSCPLMDCMSHSGEYNYHILHWNILPESFRQQQDQAYTLLRCLDAVPQENYQNIYFPDSENTEVVLRSLAHKMILSLQKAQEAAVGKKKIPGFFPDQEARKHFTEMSEHDKVSLNLAEQFLDQVDKKIVSACDISSRGNLAPLFLWQGRSTKLLMENKYLATRIWINNQLNEQEQYWQQYQDLVQKERKVTLVGTSVEVVYSALVQESEVPAFDGISGFLPFDFLDYSRIVFQGAIRERLKQLTPGGIFIFTHLLDRDKSEIEEIYLDQGVHYTMEDLPAHPSAPNHKAVLVTGTTSL